MNKASEVLENLKNSISAESILLKALEAPGVRIDRGRFLRRELKPFFSEDEIRAAVRFSPAEAGIPQEKINGVAQGIINRESNEVAAFSVLASLPVSALPAAVAAAVTADIAAYFAHILIVVQKLAYLYGFGDFGLGKKDGADPGVMDQIMVFLGVMFSVRGSGPVLEEMAGTVAKKTAKHTAKKLVKRALKIPGAGKVIARIGIKLTKQMIADAVATALPVAGSIASGALMYALFKPRCMKLKRKLKALQPGDPASRSAADSPEEQ